MKVIRILVYEGRENDVREILSKSMADGERKVYLGEGVLIKAITLGSIDPDIKILTRKEGE